LRKGGLLSQKEKRCFSETLRTKRKEGKGGGERENLRKRSRKRKEGKGL